MRRFRILSALLLGIVFAAPGAAQPLTKLVFTTNWYAQAEHGGFYQAVAEGIYRKHGLDVEIRMGGPQVNGLQILVAHERAGRNQPSYLPMLQKELIIQNIFHNYPNEVS